MALFQFKFLAATFVFIFLLAGTTDLSGETLAQKINPVINNPAAKRGLELGFDCGFEAGRQDRVQGLKPHPRRHTCYQNPNQYYRYEFGSRSSFVSAFKSGFMGGYKKAFGRKYKMNVPGIYKKPEEKVSEPSSSDAF